MATEAKTSLPAGEGKKDAVSMSLLYILWSNLFLELAKAPFRQD